jgi:hypothetical protein
LIEEKKWKLEMISSQTNNYIKHKSFADVVKQSDKNKNKTKTSHVLTIYPKDKTNEDITCSEVKNAIRNIVNPIELKVVSIKSKILGIMQLLLNAKLKTNTKYSKTKLIPK